MAESRTVVDIIDADGCIYNLSRYYPLVLWLCSHYGELDLTSGILPELEASLAQFMLRDFADADYVKFQAHCAHLQRQRVRQMHGQRLAQYEELGIDITASDVQQEIDAEFPLNRSVKYYASCYINNCIDKFNQVDKRIMNKVCEYANEPLLARMKNNAKRGDNYYVAVGSLRQGYGHDRAGMRINSTNSVFNDLIYFAALLRQFHGEEGARAAFYPLIQTDVQNGLIGGENIRRIFNQLQGEYHSYFCDPSKILILYTLIHDIVSRGESTRYVFNFYDNELPLLHELLKAFSDFPDLLPQHTLLRLHGYDGEFQVQYELQGIGSHDRNHRQNSRLLLNQAIEVAGNLDKDSVSVAKHADFQHFLLVRDLDYDPVRVLAVGLDADQCLYHKKFINLLRFVLGTYGEKIRLALESGDDLKKQEVANQVMTEISYAEATGARYAHDWYKSLKVTDADIHAAMRNRQKLFKKHHALQCQYLRHMRELNPDIVSHLLHVSNKALFDKMIASARSQNCNHIEFYNISSRQCYADDLKYSILRGVGMMTFDLPLLADSLSGCYGEQDITFGYTDILLSDLYSQSHPGTSSNGQNKLKFCDTSLLSAVYVFTHYAANSIYPVVGFECYSGNLGGIDVLHQRLHADKNNYLLPAGLTLRLIGCASNDSSVCYEVTGAGEVDLTLYDSVACMINLCVSCKDSEESVLYLDVLAELDIAAFLAQRKAQRSPCLQQFEQLTNFDRAAAQGWRVPGLFSVNEQATATDQNPHRNRPPYY